MTSQTLRTQRLILSPLNEADTETLHAIFIEPGVRRFLWDGKTIPRSQTEDIIQKNKTMFERDGFGLWMARPANREMPIGFTGFWHFRDPPQLELLYGLSSQYWSKGFATEMATAMIDYGFDELDFAVITASTDAPNRASARVLEKCGMRLTERRPVDGLDTLFYTMTRDGRTPPKLGLR